MQIIKMHTDLFENNVYMLMFFLVQQNFLKDPLNQTMSTVLFEDYCLFGFVLFIFVNILK